MALIECPECHREISERAAACPGCGYPIAEASAPAQMMTPPVPLATQPPPPSGTTASTQANTGGQPPGHGDDAFLSDYYKKNFAAIDAKGGQPPGPWNWAAFWITPIWYFAKGMWIKGIVTLLIIVSASGIEASGLSGFGWIVAVLVGFYGGNYGTYDLYLLHRYGRQGFERPRQSAGVAGVTTGGAAGGPKGGGSSHVRETGPTEPVIRGPVNSKARWSPWIAVGGFLGRLLGVAFLGVSGITSDVVNWIGAGVGIFIGVVAFVLGWKGLGELGDSDRPRGRGHASALIGLLLAFLLIATSVNVILGTFGLVS